MSKSASRLRVRTLLLMLSGQALFPSFLAQAAPKYDAAPDATDQTQIKTAILINSAATRAAVDRSNATVRRLYAKLEREVAERQSALRKARAASAEARRLQKEIDALRSQQESLMAQIERKDVEYQAGIRAFREGLTGLFGSNDPRVIDALRRYSEGDLTALDELQELVRIIRRAREAGLRARNGEDQRAVARLWYDARDNGSKSTSDALGAWREAAEIDPEDFETWIYVSRLNRTLLNFEVANEAAKRARQLADTPAKVQASLSELGDTAFNQHRYESALAFYREQLQLAEVTHAETSPDPITRSDFSGILMRLGDSEKALGRLSEARSFYLRAWAIRQSIQDELPDLQVPYRNLGVILARLAFLELQARDLQAAERFARDALKIFTGLAQMKPRSRDALWDQALAFRDYALVAEAQGDIATAQATYDFALQIYLKLYASDRSNALNAVDLRILLKHLFELSLSRKEWSKAGKYAADYVHLRRDELAKNRGDVTEKLLLAEALASSAFVAHNELRRLDMQTFYNEALGLVGEVKTRQSPALTEAEGNLLVKVLSQLEQLRLLR